MVTHTGRSEEAAEEWGYQSEYIIWGQKSQQRVVFPEIPEDTALTKAMAHPLERSTSAGTAQNGGGSSRVLADADEKGGAHRAGFVNIVGMRGLEVRRAPWQCLTDRSQTLK